MKNDLLTSETTSNQPANNQQITNNQPQIKKYKKYKNNKKEIYKEKKFDDIFAEKKFSKELETALKDFLVMRKAIKKPMTQKALELLLRNLDRLTNLEAEKIEILNQSTEHCWQTVYPLKKNNNGKTYGKRETDIDKMIDEMYAEGEKNSDGNING